jgi:hypothetical protein
MKKGSTKYTPVFNGLWRSKHVHKMGMSIYLFGELLDRVNNAGQITVTYSDLHFKTGVPIRTLERWMSVLKREGYVSLLGRSPMVVTIANFRVIRNGKIQSKTDDSIPPEVAESESPKLPDMAGSVEGAKPPKVAETLQDVAVCDSPTPLKTDSSKPSLKDKKNKRPTSKKSDDFGLRKKGQKPRRPTSSQEDKETAIFIFGKIQNIRPKFKEPNLESWANDIRLLRERDGRSHEEIKTLFSWANNHSFWQSNILSPSKLRDQWDRLEIQKSSNGNGYRSQADFNSASSGRVVL